jgi:DNA polymerase
MLYLDIETFSTQDLRATGSYRYMEDPLFEILMCAWSLDQGPIQIALGEQEIRDIPGLFTDTIVAHSPFERLAFSVLEGKYWHDSHRYVDTAVVAVANGWPRGLDKLADALGVGGKDSAGTRLINTFCKLNRGKRTYPEDKPEAWEEFKAYCVQDVQTLIDCYNAMTDYRPRLEKELYHVDQIINDRGMAIDRILAQRAAQMADKNAIRQKQEIHLLTGVENPGSVKQLLAWFEEDGFPLPNLKKETVLGYLGNTGDPIRDRVLELRLDLALVASKKYTSALNMAGSDGRIRGTLLYHGAHTGRWSGRGVQVQNLPALSFTDDDGEWDGEAEQDALDALEEGRDVDPTILKKLVRPMFVGPFVVSDYSAIEARVLAWLAGETWALKAFHAGRDLYVETAKRLGPQYDRKQGKVAVLALGYQGAVNSLRVMGGEGTDEELVKMVKAWRKANSRIVQYWYRLQDLFYEGGKIGNHTRVKVVGKDRHIILPSKRRLVYHDVKLSDGDLSFRDPRGYRQTTYGGRLTENVTQAVARDVLAEALIRLEVAGLPVVAHVHDEVLVETQDMNRVIEVMTESPKWATGMPIDADGFITERYRK